MGTIHTNKALAEEELLFANENGFLIRRRVFSPNEIEEMIQHYMAINAQGPHPGDFGGVPRITQTDAPDPLEQFPRLIQMHHYDEKTRVWMNDPRLTEPVSAIMGQRAVLIQTMLYFKPPGARGQSFHQDNLYLRTTPIAATKMPDGVELVPIVLDPGDVVYFGGLTIHGSYPNRTKDRFRRSFICHYEGEFATKLSGESQLH
jgi:phytanoyl-CoA hydroxylase